MTSLLDRLAGNAPVPEAGPSSPASPSVSAIPYNACFDPQADAFLPWMWKKMQEDDLVDYYFPGQKDTGFATFVRLMSGDAQVALFKTEDSESVQWEDRVAGFITWAPQRMGSSDVTIAGFIFFRKFWDKHTTDDAAKVAFKYWFTETPAAVVLGVCPSTHIAAMRYNKRIGLHEMGRLPLCHLYKGEVCDAVLMGMTKAEWEGKCQR